MSDLPLCKHCAMMHWEHDLAMVCPGMGGQFTYEPVDEEERPMKNNLLKGITQTIISMSTKEAAERTGVYGVVFLCFGSKGTEDSISQVQLIKGADNRMTWRAPNVTMDVGGVVKKYPVFKGRILTEVNEWAQEAFNQVKKDHKNAKYGHTYRVAGGKAFDETPEAKGEQ